MNISVVELSHDFNLIFSWFDEINIDWFVASLDVTLTECGVERVSPFAASQVTDNFSIAINRLETPQRDSVFQCQVNKSLASAIVLLPEHNILSLIGDAVLSTRKSQIRFDRCIVRAQIEAPQVIACERKSVWLITDELN